MKKHLFAVLLAAVLCVLFVVSAAAVTYTYDTAFTNPVANGADPFVLYDEGTYYLYSTNDGSNGYIAYTSTDLVNWHAAGYVLRDEDVNLVTPGTYAGLWAPEVIRDGDTYYMVYTAQEHIGIATADSPLGPFRDKTGSLFEAKAIDGHFFRDDDGKMYLYFVSCEAWNYNGYTTSGGNNIWGGEFDLATCTFVEKPKLLIQWGAGEWNVNEGPEMIKHGGTYHLTYSMYGYGAPFYSVCDATSSSPLGTFEKQGTVLITADPSRSDPDNNLYGTAHHCFVRMPDGRLMIVYHAHRSGKKSPLIQEQNPNAKDTDLYVEVRRVCIDEAWFDADGKLRAGDRNNVGHPTVSASVVPTGASATRSIELDDNFAALVNLPTVYVSMKGGLDTNAGTKLSPFRTLDKAYASIPNGGTIVLLEMYDMASASAAEYGITTMDACYVSPKVNGPVMIRGAFSAVPVEFKFWSISSDTYLENLELRPRTIGAQANGYSVIECGQNNVVIGENVSCASRPNSAQFPVLVGGYWQFGKASVTHAYVHFNTVNRPDSMLTTDKAYSLTVKGGTWEHIYPGSMKATTYLENSAPNATLKQSSGANIRPAKVTGVKAELSMNGAVISYNADAEGNALKYRITDANGNLVGYSETTEFVDTAYVVGTTKTYQVSGYVNGACIGGSSAPVTVSSYGDMNGDGEITLADALLLLADILNGDKNVSLANVLWQLNYIASK